MKNAGRSGPRLVLALLASFVFVLCSGGAISAWSRYADSSGGEVPPYVDLASEKTLGVNADLYGLERPDIEKFLATVEGAGLDWLRQRFPWDEIETAPGTYDWNQCDAIVAGVAERGLELVAVLDGAPAWARPEEDAENSLAPPAETRGFGDFVAAFAMRYAELVTYYQIWDEPNIAPHWGAGEIEPAAYVRLLREGSIRVRAADTDAVVLLAALAPNVEAGGENMSDVVFLDAIYREGGAEWFDLVAAQPYSFEWPVNAPPAAGQLNWRRVELLRDVMTLHGDQGTAIWAVSFGVPFADGVGVADAVEYSRKEWPWMGTMIWAASFPSDRHNQYALLSESGRTNAAFDLLQAVALGPELAWPGAYPADHPTGDYRGNWRVTPSGADIGSTGDLLTIPFHGTRLDLTVRRGDYRAFLYVSVDGEPANSLPFDTGGRAYVVLYDPLHRVDTVALARGLSDGDHVAQIQAERGWGQWAILGWTVSRESSVAVLVLGLALTLGGGAGLGVALLAAWPDRRRLVRAALALVAWYRALDDRVVLIATAAAVIVLYLMEGTLLVLVALGILALFLLLRPEMGLPIIAVSLPFYQLGRPLLGKVFSVVEIVVLLTAVGWGVEWLLTRWARSASVTGPGSLRTEGAPSIAGRLKSLSGLDWGLLVLLAISACSLLWAEQGREAAREFRTVVFEASIFYGLLRSMLPKLKSAEQESGRATWRVVDAWVLGGSLIATVGLGQWILGENLITAEGVGRVRGFYGSPNNLALYLGRVLPLVVAVAAWGQSGRRRWSYLLAAVLIAGAMFLTYSRGAWIVGVPASLLFLAALRGRRVLVAAVGILVVVAIAVLMVVGPGRLTSLLDIDSGTTFFRVQLWRSSIAMITDHPVLGVGLDNFLYAYRSSYVQPSAWAEFDLSHPHNFVLDFWLRLGISGLAAVIWLLVVFFRQAWVSYRSLNEGDVRLLVLGLMAGMVSFVAHGLVDNAFFLVDLAFVFVLMLAVVQAVDRDPRVPDAQGRAPAERLVSL